MQNNQRTSPSYTQNISATSTLFSAHTAREANTQYNCAFTDNSILAKPVPSQKKTPPPRAPRIACVAAIQSPLQFPPSTHMHLGCRHSHMCAICVSTHRTLHIEWRQNDDVMFALDNMNFEHILVQSHTRTTLVARHPGNFEADECIYLFTSTFAEWSP